MFRIKKDDYNTVQFLPDFQSSRSSRRNQKKQKPARAVESTDSKIRRAKFRGKLAFLAVILVIILLAVWMVYSHFLTEEARYIRLFRQSEYSQCEEIAKNHINDPSFKESIESTVTGAVNDAVTQYLAREVTEEETQNNLTQYDQASAQLFQQYIGDNQHWITTVESIYNKADQAENEAVLGYYVESVTTLQQVVEEAGKNGLIFDQRITQILRDHLNGYKASLFVSFSDTFRNSSDYTTVKDTVAFINQYIRDDDFAEFPDVIAKLESGEYTKVAAARMARQIAKDAGADIEVNEGSGSSANSSGSASGSSGKNSSSSKRSSKSSSGNSSGSRASSEEADGDNESDNT